MKISIITVVYNNEATIQQAMESVLNQTYSDIEYVIIDGNSMDKTVSIIETYKNRLGYFISERDQGLYDAMNKGIQAATGDVIGILNSDDLYQDSTVIADIVNQFNLDPDLEIVYGNLVYVKKDAVNQVVRNWKSKDYYSKFFDDGNVPPHPSLFLKREVYQKVGLFDLEFKLAADYEFMFRVFKKHHFKSKYINRLIVKMRLGGETNKSIRNIINQNKEIMQAWKQNGLNPPLKLMPLRISKRLGQFIKR
ncbi:glycosyltransferase family 2 protein [Flavobacterium sp.]|uniref:glycosyltransferase family 2 protein n=1 Tax=Flavobacterium sp. TaxID=239 RepID=UPI00286EA3E3|nr:glycosyltransferase family 2 protein [Flavobacterium sp.]